MDLILDNGELRWGDHIYPHTIGRSGIIAEKVEGDGGTPVGRFPFRRVFFRPERLKAFETVLPLTPITRQDGWCDDVTHIDYNRHITLPHPARHEELWRDDNLYDVILVVGHNDEPPIAGKGSAIFVHLRSPDHKPTEGCVALDREDLLQVLSQCTLDSALIVKVDK